MKQLIGRQDRQDILDWLSPIDFATQQSDFISRRQPSTGEWLLKSDQLKNWMALNNQTLFCPGIPGAGKTMIAAAVIDELHSLFEDDTSVSVLYIYCNFRRQLEQRPIDLLANMLKQLTQKSSSVPQSIDHLYKHHQKGRTRPSTNEICQALQSVVRAHSKTFIIVDALDECEAADGALQRFISELFDLQAKTQANLLVTSRFIPDIERCFEGRSTKLEIRASDEDLKRYLDGSMLKLPRFVSRSADIQREIKTAIIKAATGMLVP